MAKYRYKTRQEAEDAAAQAEAQSFLYLRALMAIDREEVAWTTRMGPHRLGLFDIDSASGPRCILKTYHSESKCDLDVYYWERWEQAIASIGGLSNEIVTLRRLVEHGRRILHRAAFQEAANQ